MGSSSSHVKVDEYRGQVVWVVGASSGIGEGLAEAYHARGAKVIVSGRREAELERVADRLNAIDGTEAKPRVLTLPMDATELDKAAEVCQKALALHGGTVDVVVLSQGISNRGNVADTDLSVEQRIFQVNFFSYVALVKKMLPHFRERQQGRFVVVSSVQGFFGLPGRAPYAASKHALHGYFESLRSEVKHENVHVSILCPGYVRTELSLRALTTDASTTHAAMDDATAKGFSPEYFANKALRGIAKGKEYIVVAQPSAKLAIWLKGHMPGVLRGIMNKRGKKAAAQQ